MTTDDIATPPNTTSRIAARLLAPTTAVAIGLILATDPALAQSPGSDFCQTAMADTAKNLFGIIQFGGPLIGGVIALGATVATPAIRRADLKKELKETRNQAVVWGIIVAPLAALIVQFLLNSVVAGGASCGF